MSVETQKRVLLLERLESRSLLAGGIIDAPKPSLRLHDPSQEIPASEPSLPTQDHRASRNRHHDAERPRTVDAVHVRRSESNGSSRERSHGPRGRSPNRLPPTSPQLELTPPPVLAPLLDANLTDATELTPTRIPTTTLPELTTNREALPSTTAAFSPAAVTGRGVSVEDPPASDDSAASDPRSSDRSVVSRIEAPENAITTTNPPPAATSIESAERSSEPTPARPSGERDMHDRRDAAFLDLTPFWQARSPSTDEPSQQPWELRPEVVPKLREVLEQQVGEVAEIVDTALEEVLGIDDGMIALDRLRIPSIGILYGPIPVKIESIVSMHRSLQWLAGPHVPPIAASTLDAIMASLDDMGRSSESPTANATYERMAHLIYPAIALAAGAAAITARRKHATPSNQLEPNR